ncbi:MAG: hypothetical protein E7020_04870 [Alphaproteobacteria bacterium]|nr:hypothetical protein [Alphaproteobacteria bacterium]
MQYLLFFILFLVTISVFVWALIKIARLKYIFLQKIVIKKIINKPFFSTLAVKRFVKYVFNQKKDKQRLFLKNIMEDKFTTMIKIIDNPQIQAELKLMISGKLSKIKLSDYEYGLICSAFYLNKNQITKAQNILQKIDKNNLDKTNLAFWCLQQGQLALFEGDLLTASEQTARSLRFFQKNNLFFEEALAYFVLGNVYRVSGVFDSADFMLRSALKLFKFLGAKNKEAEVLGTFALLMSVQQRFDEAEDYLTKAELILSENCDLWYFINCQKAMLALISGNLKLTKKRVNLILKKTNISTVIAMANDILARVAMVENRFNAAIKHASLAANIYDSEQNLASLFECQYITAEAYAKNNNLDKAELVLRKLINREKHYKSCFYVANAYTLLGLILLQKGKINRAKAIMNQALRLELFSNRKTGAAVDYANLAIVEKKQGNIYDAHKNLAAALQYAKDTDKDLYDMLKNALD